ncbi:DEAD/DEAH box helicase [Humisphaera borealis]|uniref:SNF2 helicase associated domain-containing protein n=1 Tax=Humisphaera borealis TaxID=2807512 RepID=A0A7M2WR21_9BACT|nr:DEAD/DEAH box helicase [Humisphaera borealis]QOV87602.1 SNF2 helicase associated domain-containing protein [Humisphaera borealis]
MSVLQDYSHDFPADVKHRGDEYYRQGRVKIIDGDSSFVEGEIEGSRLYRASIDGDHDGITYDCTCEYFDENGPCKHLWALALEANRAQRLPLPPRPVQAPVGDDEEPEMPRVQDDSESADTLEDEDIDGDAPGLPPTRNQQFPPLSDLRRMTPAELLNAMRNGSQNNGVQNTGHQMIGRGNPQGFVRTPDIRNAEDLWKAQLSRLSEAMRMNPVSAPRPLSWPQGRRVLYVIDAEATLDSGLTIQLMHETPKRDGVLERPKPLRLTQSQISQLPDPTDRHLVQLLEGTGRSGYGYYDAPLEMEYEIDPSAYEDILRAVCATGRCRLAPRDGRSLASLSWDEGPPWEFSLRIQPSPGGRYLVLEGALHRQIPLHPDILDSDESVDDEPDIGDDAPADEIATADAGSSAAAVTDASEHVPMQSLALAEPQLLLNGAGLGYVFLNSRISRLQHYDAFPLIAALRSGEKISVPLDKQQELMKTLLKFPRLPKLELPPELDIRQISPEPRPRLKISSASGKAAVAGARDGLIAKLTFDYDGVMIDSGEKKAAIMVEDGQTLIRRNAHREAEFLAELPALGFRDDYNYWNSTRELRLPLNKMPKAVGELTRKGWTVEADGKLYRSAGQVNVSVSSGIDWFELRGDVSFDGMTASLPRLLAALRKGETVIKLDDGTFGLLPEEWLKKYAGIAGMGETEGDHIKFSSRQIGFLDAMLSALPDARFDETFSKARDELMRFSGVEAIEPPATFIGTLRQYQSEGLGWMKFLRKFGFGGVLADDMGLGKTVQVLALLEARRRERVATPDAQGNVPSTLQGTASGPSLVVAPRSLIFNWRQEALKFSPNLRVLDHTAVDRVRSADHFKDYDLVLTTYGTLRRDMSYFRDIRFDYAILDEAQAIKNASSESAKAARLVQADHRLALSGTPVQNHLGELWSLFDYLNPGMMGSVGVFRDLSADAANRDVSARELLARALRPFVLRRTKEQVAKDLPEKLEQTIYCELEKDQRKLYDELRDHYRTSLLDRVAKEGMNKAKIMVLEALLRLRQAACHPGLIDKKRSKEPSAKLETLMERIAEVVDEGHKVLIFSQFTSMLAIVKERLDDQKFVYEYLDGRTKDRQAHVDRFQSDPDCKLFLISLKAGGVGLNLTAADYVFLLDPWWNPAVEAQAIDRAHRIGQDKRVFAYRLIAKDTVEEKVVQLQQSKRELADAIINADNSLIRGLSREDLEMLLS